MKHRVFEHKTKSGAAGLVIDVPGSDVVNLQVRFNSGYQFADPTKYEVPHILEHLLATVTQAHPGPNEFNIEVQKNGAYMNASTSVDANGYIYECADFELDRIFDLLEEQITAPLFQETAFRAEMGNVREELTRNTTQHGSVCALALAEAAFPDQWQSYERRMAQFEAITLADLKAHYHHTHTAVNARFFVAGHFPDGGVAVRRRMDRIFRLLPRGYRLEGSRQIGRGLEQPLLQVRDIAQLYYRISWYFGELSEPERRALTLLRMILVGGMGSRIFGEARRRGWAYGVGGVGHAEPGNSSFGFVGYVTPANAVALFQLVARELAAVCAGAATEKELQAAKNLLVGSVTRSVQTAGDVLGWYLEPYEEAGEVRDLERNLELLRAVSLADVMAVAQRVTAEHRQGISFVGAADEAAAKHYAHILTV